MQRIVRSAKKAHMVRSSGADHVLDYTLSDVVDGACARSLR
jgi:NADPH:quinone reductase-like Zn-dependent oxidoreductase